MLEFWVVDDYRVVVKGYEELVGLVLDLVAPVEEALAEANDVLLRYEIRGHQVADQANLDLVLEDHCVDALVDQLDVLDRVGHGRVLHRRVELDVEAIKLDQPIEVPNAHLAIGGGGDEVSRTTSDRRQRSYGLRMALEDVYGL